MSPSTAEFLAAPDLPILIGKAQRFLDREAKKRGEFRDAILPHEKGEFINGEIIKHSPARHSHNHVSLLVNRVLGTYVSAHSLGYLLYEKVLCGFSRNDYEPDLVWFGPQKASLLTADTVVYPVPDLIIEIVSPSTEARDRGVKFEDYAAHGVKEYWIIDADARTIEQYLLSEADEVYQLAEKLAHGDIKPASFPGLAIPLAAFFEDTANLAFLRGIL